MVGSDLVQVIKEAFVCSLDRAAASLSDSSHLVMNSIADIENSGVKEEEAAAEAINSLVESMDNLSIDVPSEPRRLNVCMNQSDLFAALRKVSPSALREVAIEVPNIHWKDIGGMETVKQSLAEVSVLC